jgi:hypothetical protein
MPRSQSEFIVVSPEKPGRGEPVLAIAPGIFEQNLTSEEHLVPLPLVVDDVELCKGVVLTGIGYIFKASGAEVMPDKLEVVSTPGQRPELPDAYRGKISWD